MLAVVNTNALAAATSELRAAGPRAIGVTCDVADEAQVAAMVEQTISELGRLDIAFNNAGILGYTATPLTSQPTASIGSPPSTCAASGRA